MKMRKLTKIVAVALIALLAAPAANVSAQPAAFLRNVDSVSGSASTTNADVPCILVKYVGSGAGKPTVETAAGGDVTFKIATVADVTTGSAANGIFDLSTPAAAEDTWGEVVNLINTQG